MDPMLHLEALVLNLEVEVLFAENVCESSGGCAGGIIIALGQTFGDFALDRKSVV